MIQENNIIDERTRDFNLPHRTDIEIVAILFGHSLLKRRNSCGLIQHVDKRRGKLEKLAGFALAYRALTGKLETSCSMEMSFPYSGNQKS